MKQSAAKAQLVASAIYLAEGILAILVAGIALEEISMAVFWECLGFWILGIVVMLIGAISGHMKPKSFIYVHAVFYTILGIGIQGLYHTNTLVYIVFLTEWMVAICFLDRRVFVFLTVFQSLLFSILTFVPMFEPLSGFQAYNLQQYAVMIVTEFFFLWIANTLQKSLSEAYAENKDTEQSLDDMVSLVERKHIEAVEANKSKSEFLSNMSHEIRTPINTILGMNEMILRESEADNVSEYAENIASAGNSLLSLVNDILDFSKIEAGKMELVESEYHLKDLIKELAVMEQKRLDDKDILFKVFVQENLPGAYWGDDVKLRQILVNLLTNAAKYTKQGSVEFHVTGVMEGDFAKLTFLVKDTGIGIKKEDISHLADAFVRLDQQKNKTIEGTGLGMSIVKNHLQLLNSELQIESEYGKGSSFYFTITQRITDRTPVGVWDADRYDRNSTKLRTVGFIAPDARILVVDDNRMNLKVFAGLLKHTKIVIDMADSGKKALEMTSEVNYDLIFMDHMMPEMDGIETFRELRGRAHARNCNTPVFALTANAISGAREMYLSEGFSGYLTKPVKPRDLEETIQYSLPPHLIMWE